MDGQAAGAASDRHGAGGSERPKWLAHALQGVLTALLPTVLLLAPIVPAATAIAAPAQGPMLCQTLADGYEAQRSDNPSLPALFDAPFSFDDMDWADDAGAKAVNVLKQQHFAAAPGTMGALFCLPDGMIKQVVTCAETAKTDGEMPALEHFRRVAGALIETIGAPDSARARFADAVDAASGAGEADAQPPGGFIKLDGPIYAFITGEDGAVCMTISQTTNADAQ